MTAQRAERDHGGDLGAAMRRFGGGAADWIDISTGINRIPYPLPALPERVWRDLPGAEDMQGCAEAARRAYDAAPGAACLPTAGAQAAIQILPGLRPAGRAGVLGPTYNEYAAVFAAAGWSVTIVRETGALAGFDAAVVVNPNNPDGRCLPPEAVLALRDANRLLIVDESFADLRPGRSICARSDQPGLIALRSFGKFFGLAGLRLGFALGAEAEIAPLAQALGPWPVSGPALAAGRVALADTGWAEATRRRLAADAARLDRLASAAGWRCAGGTDLFRLYEVGDARAAQERLACARIWSRLFPYSRNWLRLGLPGPEAEWRRLTEALG